MKFKIGTLPGMALLLLYLMSCTPESNRDLTAYVKTIKKLIYTPI